MTELAIGFWVAVVVLGGVLSVLGSRYEKAPEVAGKGPRLGLAVELVATPVAFAELVGAAGTARGDRNRRLLRLGTWIDFPFIAAYGGFFFVLGLGERLGTFAGAALLGFITLGAIALAAVFDVLEDLAILRALAGRAPRGVRRFGIPKWYFYFLAAASVAPLFILHPGRGAVSLAAGILLPAGAVVGLWAIALRRDPLIERGLGLTALGIFAAGLALLLGL